MFDVKKFDVMRDDEIITEVKSWKLKKNELLNAIEFIEDKSKKDLSTSANGYNCTQGNYRTKRGYAEKVELNYF